MDDTYKTIAGPAEGYYTEKRSRFLSFALPVHSVEEVKEAIARFRKEYYDARHVCWAYMLGADRKTFRAIDDGFHRSICKGYLPVGRQNPEIGFLILRVIKEARADTTNLAEIVCLMTLRNTEALFPYQSIRLILILNPVAVYIKRFRIVRQQQKPHHPQQRSLLRGLERMDNVAAIFFIVITLFSI